MMPLWPKVLGYLLAVPSVHLTSSCRGNRGRQGPKQVPLSSGHMRKFAYMLNIRQREPFLCLWCPYDKSGTSHTSDSLCLIDVIVVRKRTKALNNDIMTGMPLYEMTKQRATLYTPKNKSSNKTAFGQTFSRCWQLAGRHSINASSLIDYSIDR